MIVGDQPLIRPSSAASITWACSTSTRSTSATSPRMKREFADRAAEHGFHAFADAFALGFQILQQFLAESNPERCSLAAPKLLADVAICWPIPGRFLRRHPASPADRRCLAAASSASAAIGRALQAIRFADHDAPAIAQALLLGGDVFPLDLDRAQPAVHCASLRIRSSTAPIYPARPAG
jgi:hypothetical protein